jgi:hypothetical protein
MNEENTKRLSELNELEQAVVENGRFTFMLMKASVVKALVDSSRKEIINGEIYQEAIQAISKICNAHRYNDLSCHILCECNRVLNKVKYNLTTDGHR